MKKCVLNNLEGKCYERALKPEPYDSMRSFHLSGCGRKLLHLLTCAKWVFLGFEKGLLLCKLPLETYRASAHARVSAHPQTVTRLITMGGLGAYSVKCGITFALSIFDSKLDNRIFSDVDN